MSRQKTRKTQTKYCTRIGTLKVGLVQQLWFQNHPCQIAFKFGKTGVFESRIGQKKKIREEGQFRSMEVAEMLSVPSELN